MRNLFLKSLFIILPSLSIIGKAFATNTSTGTNALSSLTTGSFNTAIGYESLYTNTSGSNNTAVGSKSLKLNTTGYGNTAIGDETMEGNTTGIQQYCCRQKCASR